jgi:hypothetical protein
MGGSFGIGRRHAIGARGRGRLSAVVAVALLVAAVSVFGATAAGAARKSPFKPGLYVGKTSQGYPVKLRLTVGGEPCSGNPCLFAPNDEAEIYIALECPAIGQATNEYLDLAGDLVTKSGTVNASEEGFAKVAAKLKVSHGGSLTGKVRATRTLEEGTKCDSGNVTLSAKIGGSTK